jgi:NAD-dependent dihydropyrimidine dehydrogenase PreA subunit
MSHENEKHEISSETLNVTGLSQQFSRREFLVISGVMVVAVSALEAWGAKDTPLIIMDQAEGLVIADPTKCVSCRRCELACTEFNDGKASPAILDQRALRRGNEVKAPGETGWSSRMFVNNVRILCPVRTPVRMMQSL